MRKFVGLVNGKSFDNEKDFNEAAKNAIQSNEENLSISSYYSYIKDDEQEKLEEKKDGKYLCTSEYILVSQEPVKDENGNITYPLSEELKNKILEASNQAAIKENSNQLISQYNNRIKSDEADILSMEKDIDVLKKKITDKRDEIKNLQSRQQYYNTILDVLTEKENASKQIEEKKEEKKPISIADVRELFGNTSFYDALRQLGLFI